MAACTQIKDTETDTDQKNDEKFKRMIRSTRNNDFIYEVDVNKGMQKHNHNDNSPQEQTRKGKDLLSDETDSVTHWRQSGNNSHHREVNDICYRSTPMRIKVWVEAAKLKYDKNFATNNKIEVQWSSISGGTQMKWVDLHRGDDSDGSKQVTVCFYSTSGVIFIQGKYIQKWSDREYQQLKAEVDRLIAEKVGENKECKRECLLDVAADKSKQTPQDGGAHQRKQYAVVNDDTSETRYSEQSVTDTTAILSSTSGEYIRENGDMTERGTQKVDHQQKSVETPVSSRFSPTRSVLLNKARSVAMRKESAFMETIESIESNYIDLSHRLDLIQQDKLDWQTKLASQDKLTTVCQREMSDVTIALGKLQTSINNTNTEVAFVKKNIMKIQATQNTILDLLKATVNENIQEKRNHVDVSTQTMKLLCGEEKSDLQDMESEIQKPSDETDGKVIVNIPISNYYEPLDDTANQTACSEHSDSASSSSTGQRTIKGLHKPPSTVNRGRSNTTRYRSSGTAHSDSLANSGKGNFNTVIIGDSTVKYIDPLKFSTSRKTFVKTLRGKGIDEAREFVGVAKLKNPQNIVLHIGSNNIANGTPLDMCKKKYEELIDTTRATYPKSKVFISSILPRLCNDDFDQASCEFNDTLRLMSENSQNLHFIQHNFRDRVNNTRLDLFEDEVHPNFKGTAFMVTNMKRGIYKVILTHMDNNQPNPSFRKEQTPSKYTDRGRRYNTNGSWNYKYNNNSNQYSNIHNDKGKNLVRDFLTNILNFVNN